MAWTQQDIDALKSSIATGAMRVRYADGREVQFRSMKEMRETLSMLEASVAGSAEPRVSFAKFGRD